MNIDEETSEQEQNPIAYTPGPLTSLIKSILLTKSKVLSFSVLTLKGKFKTTINKENGKILTKTVIEELTNLGIGRVDTFTIQGNKTEVR